MKPGIHISFAFISVLFLYSCEKEKQIEKPLISYEQQGVFIVNEGAFGNNNGSVSYINPGHTGIIPDLFKMMNGVTAGDLVQSMNIYNGKGYIVVNNSQKIEVVNIYNFHSITTIGGFSGPRYFLPVTSSKAYVSDWFSNTVKVIDLNTFAITASITTGAGPEQMALANGKVYITNVGGFGNDSTVTVVDASSDAVLTTIKVGLNPNSIAVNNNGEVIVLCSGTTGPDFTGGTPDDIGGRVVRIDPITDAIVQSQDFSQFIHPVKLVSNSAGNKIYFLYGNDSYTGEVYELIDSAFQFEKRIGSTFYGLGIEPVTGNIYGGRAGFSANCYVLRYESNGTLIDSVKAGIGPNSFVFR